MVTPLVEIGEKYKIPSWITLTAVLLIVFLLGSIVVGTLIPIVVNYISDVVNAISSWAVRAKEIYTNQGIHGFQFHPYIERGILLLF
jgi:predicted PurR-regulated permease PerM